MRIKLAALALTTALIGASAAGTTGSEWRSGASARAVTSTHAPDEISVLTYNVQDLPWPLAGDRTADLQAIGDRLLGLRQAAAAPQFVVLQEAFSDESVAMLKAAGYRHIVKGPDQATPRPANPQPLSADFLAARSFTVGEGQGPVMNSGLVIASDYPITRVASEPFPQDACAGFDCLANKSMMLVQIKVPGLSRPVELLNAHLNAGRKSGTPTARHLYAYRRQLEALDRFVAKHRTPGLPAVFAGDFNISHSQDRLASFRIHYGHWAARPVTAMGKPKYESECDAKPATCRGELPIAANVPLEHSIDWHFTAGEGVKPMSRAVLFGPDDDGRMLSDHIGFAVRYRLTRGS